MGERVRPSRSGLAAIELVIAVGVFTLCAAVCMGLLVRADGLSRSAGDLTRAVGEARTAAECYKAAAGDLSRTAELTGGALDGEALTLFYDGAWTRSAEESASFSLTMVPRQIGEPQVREAELQVTGPDGEALLAWTVAAWEDGP